MITFEILFAVHLKHSGFWPSADVNLVSNVPLHTMALTVHVCPLYVYINISMGSKAL
jgi:hypothetical protein